MFAPRQVTKALITPLPSSLPLFILYELQLLLNYSLFFLATLLIDALEQNPDREHFLEC